MREALRGSLSMICCITVISVVTPLVSLSLLKSATLSAGWLLVTFRGGHGFSAVADDTTIIECKLGPYIGRDYEFF